MRKSGSYWLVVSVVLAGLGVFGGAQPFAGDMSFFVSSTGSGKGGDLGGLEGADRICRTLAEAAGAGGKTWRAYLSTQGPGAVSARYRIGAGPWVNAKGVVIAIPPPGRSFGDDPRDRSRTACLPSSRWRHRRIAGGGSDSHGTRTDKGRAGGAGAGCCLRG